MKLFLDFFHQNQESFQFLYYFISFLFGGVSTAVVCAYKWGGHNARRKIDTIHFAEQERCIDQEKERYYEQRIRADALEAEIRVLKELAYFGHWPYHPHDEPPRRLLCPKCKNVMKVEDDTAKVADDHGVQRYEPALRLTCASCEFKDKVFGLEMKGLADAIGWICQKPKDTLIS